MTVRGNAFNVDYTGESKEDIFITAEVQKGKKNSLFCSQKRAKINSTKEIFFKKLKNLKYLAYNIRGYTLLNCWYLFKCKRPKGFNAKGIYIKKVHKKVEHDRDLAAQVK